MKSLKAPYHLWQGLPRWKQTLFLICITQGITSTGWTFMSPLYPIFIQEELGIGDAKEAAFWAGLTSGVFAISMGLAGPFWGYLADRHGRKPLLIRAYAAGSLILLLSGLVTNVTQLMGVRVLHGAISGSVGPSMALAASAVPRNRMALAVGMLQFANFFAISIGPLIGGQLANAMGFRTTYFISSAVVAISTLTVTFFVHENFQRPQDARSGISGLFNETRDVLRTKGLLPVLMVLPILQSAPVIMQPVVPGFIQSITQEGNVITGAGLAFALLGMTSGVSAIFIGRFSSRLNLRNVLIFCCFGASLAFLPQLFVHNYLIFLALFALFGLFSGGMLTAINAMVGMLIPKRNLGAAFGVVNSANAMAWGLGPLAGGSLAWSIGHRRVFPVTSVMLAVTGAAVAVIFKGIRAPAIADRRAATTKPPSGTI